MIRFHGGNCSPLGAAMELWTRRNAMVSFAKQDQIDIAMRIAVSVALDNGAFSSWKSGIDPDWEEYARWVEEYRRHPTFAWAVIPDRIDGTEQENQELIEWWRSKPCAKAGVPVWHMHESLEKLESLVTHWDLVAIGSSGEYKQPGTLRWWSRMSAAMGVACDAEGRPKSKLHGLRQMDSTIFSHVPYTSVDSAAIARHICMDSKTPRAYRHLPPKARAIVLALDADLHMSAARWTGTIATQKNLEMSFGEAGEAEFGETGEDE